LTFYENVCRVYVDFWFYTDGGYMALLQVPDFPDDIYEDIIYEAQRGNRTIAEQTIALITRSLGEGLPNKERRHRLLEKLKTQPRIDLGGIDSATVIREMREERTQAIINAIEGRS
jgi:hypothetical protein